MNSIFNCNKLILALFFTLVANFASAQPNGVEMADALRESGKIYVVVAVLLIIFLGISIYLFMIDNKLRKLEKENQK
jgi:CcmD family protein